MRVWYMKRKKKNNITPTKYRKDEMLHNTSNNVKNSCCCEGHKNMITIMTDLQNKIVLMSEHPNKTGLTVNQLQTSTAMDTNRCVVIDVSSLMQENKDGLTRKETRI